MNELGRTLGYIKNDEFISINEKELTAQNANDLINDLYASAKTGDSLLIKVMRKNSTGNDTPVELKGTMMKFPVIKYNVLTFSDTPSQDQLMLRNAWLQP
jgi:hypothetical protein